MINKVRYQWRSSERRCKNCDCGYKVKKIRRIKIIKKDYKSIIDKDSFCSKCPKCGAVNEEICKLTYYDKTKGIYILLWPEYNLNNFIHRCIRRIMSKVLRILYGKKCTLRIVRNIEDLIEKIEIFDDDLYDIYVEIVKRKYRTFLIKEGRKNMENYFIESMYYSRSGDKPIIRVVERWGKEITIPWSKYEYDLIAENNDMKGIREYDYQLELINTKWIKMVYSIRNFDNLV